MAAWPRIADRVRSRVRGGALAFALAFCVGLVAALGWLMLREIGNFANADADNPRWTLSQVDAEFLQFRLGLEQAQRDPRMLDALRRRFDVIYTRVKSLREGDAYSTLRNNREFEAACLSVSGFLDAVVPLIDGPDSVLLAALPQIRARAAAQNEAQAADEELVMLRSELERILRKTEQLYCERREATDAVQVRNYV